jgi:hypothetical protein
MRRRQERKGKALTRRALGRKALTLAWCGNLKIVSSRFAQFLQERVRDLNFSSLLPFLLAELQIPVFTKQNNPLGDLRNSSFHTRGRTQSVFAMTAPTDYHGGAVFALG